MEFRVFRKVKFWKKLGKKSEDNGLVGFVKIGLGVLYRNHRCVCRKWLVLTDENGSVRVCFEL